MQQTKDRKWEQHERKKQREMKVVFRIHAAKKGQEMKMQYEEKKEHRFK